MIRTLPAILCALVVASCPTAARAQDDAASGILTYSNYGGMLTISERDKRFVGSLAQQFEDVPLTLRLELSAPLDTDTRVATLVGARGLAPGFGGSIYLGWSSFASVLNRPDLSETGADGIEVGGQFSLSYDRFDVRDATDASVTHVAEPARVAAHARIIGHLEPDARVHMAVYALLGYRFRHLVDTRPIRVCDDVATTGTATVEHCEDVRQLRGMATDSHLASARLGWLGLFDLGLADTQLGGNVEVGFETPGDATAWLLRAILFFSPLTQPASLRFGIGTDVRISTPGDAVEATLYALVGATSPWRI